MDAALSTVVEVAARDIARQIELQGVDKAEELILQGMMAMFQTYKAIARAF